MTDNGLAALAAALERVAMRPSGLSIASYEEHAAAILDPRGVFLPDGHPLGVEDAIAQGQQMLAERDATIATLRAALGRVRERVDGKRVTAREAKEAGG
jgi:hypothetical protein